MTPSAASPRGTPGAARRALDGLLLAVAFLTIVPVRLRGSAPALGAAAPWFPLVGASVGAVAGALAYVAAPELGPTVAAILAVSALVVVTGALHQDGLADCADGLGVRGDRPRRLEVMRDSAIGTFGALALILWVALMVAALRELPRGDMLEATIVLAAVGRWSALLHAAWTPSARTDGLGAGFTVTTTALGFATSLAGAAALLLVGIGDGLVACGAAAVVTCLVTVWARKSLGGRTGDTLGATVALAEVAIAVTWLGIT